MTHAIYGGPPEPGEPEGLIGDELDRLHEEIERLSAENSKLSNFIYRYAFEAGRHTRHEIDEMLEKQEIPASTRQPLHDAENPTNMDALFKASRELRCENPWHTGETTPAECPECHQRWKT